jgi:hypothetical protein
MKKILTADYSRSHRAEGVAEPVAPMRKQRFTKKSPTLLKPNWPLLVFWLPRHAVRAPFGGSDETGAGGVRPLLVPILLNGGFGYENLRLHSPLAVHDRF